MAKIGIRVEDKYKFERRTPLVPKDIKQLIEKHNLEFYVQSSDKRIFKDSEYEQVGAKVVPNLKDCDIIFGVKEIPIEALEPHKTYVFFSHVIKGQPHNMPMLKRLIELKCNLIDYEKVEDDLNRRLIFFGRFAGLAGMINTLWSIGQRYKALGIENPFTKIRQAYTYASLDDAKKDISQVGMDILKNGLPENLIPFVVAFTGYGNVSSGAQEIFNLLPNIEIEPDEVFKLSNLNNKNIIYKIVFKEKDIAERISDGGFDLEEYYTKPELYKSKFEKYVPHLNAIVNGIYWDERYPRLLTKQYLKQIYSSGQPKLTVVGDISCDVNGSIECTFKGTEIDNPVYLYDPLNETYSYGFEGFGLLDMAVDILPSELPKESSEAFSAVLKRFVPAIANADYNKDFENINLLPPIKKAMILHKGELTNPYKYIEKFLI